MSDVTARHREWNAEIMSVVGRFFPAMSSAQYIDLSNKIRVVVAELEGDPPEDKDDADWSIRNHPGEEGRATFEIHRDFGHIQPPNQGLEDAVQPELVVAVQVKSVEIAKTFRRMIDNPTETLSLLKPLDEECLTEMIYDNIIAAVQSLFDKLQADNDALKKQEGKLERKLKDKDIPF